MLSVVITKKKISKKVDLMLSVVISKIPNLREWDNKAFPRVPDIERAPTFLDNAF